MVFTPELCDAKEAAAVCVTMHLPRFDMLTLSAYNSRVSLTRASG